MGSFGCIACRCWTTTSPNDHLASRLKGSRDTSNALNLHPALHKLALDPSNSGTWESQQAFREFAEDHGLQRAWYSLSIRLTQRNGEVLVAHVNRRPYELGNDLFPEFVEVLATAAGYRRPPGYTDFSRATVSVIPDRFLTAEPGEAFPELLRLEARESSQNAMQGRESP